MPYLLTSFSQSLLPPLRTFRLRACVDVGSLGLPSSVSVANLDGTTAMCPVSQMYTRSPLFWSLKHSTEKRLVALLNFSSVGLRTGSSSACCKSGDLTLPAPA